MRRQAFCPVRKLHKVLVWKVTTVTVITLGVKLPSVFLLLPLAVDWYCDNMAKVTNNETLPSSKGYETEKSDLCREFGLVNFTIQAVCKNLTAEDRWNVYSSQILTVILKLKLMME